MSDHPNIRVIQRFVARVAVGPSTLRNQARGKVISRARQKLTEVDLNEFTTKDGDRFMDKLNRATDCLLSACKKYDLQWGSARKALNIFLRDSLYNFYLRKHYRLDKAGPLFEVALDKKVATKLLKSACELHLDKENIPQWSTIRGLTPQDSNRFQEIARREAGRRGLWRVHLDAKWWSE